MLAAYAWKILDTSSDVKIVIAWSLVSRCLLTVEPVFLDPDFDWLSRAGFPAVNLRAKIQGSGADKIREG